MKWFENLKEIEKDLEEMKSDERLTSIIEEVDARLQENLSEKIEADRMREQKTHELSRQYFLG